MKLSDQTLWIITIISLLTVFPVGVVGLCILLYRYNRRYQDTKKDEKLLQRHQREIELKEIEMVRKSNEILIHLIQDQGREPLN